MSSSSTSRAHDSPVASTSSSAQSTARNTRSRSNSAAVSGTKVPRTPTRSSPEERSSQSLRSAAANPVAARQRGASTSARAPSNGGPPPSAGRPHTGSASKPNGETSRSQQVCAKCNLPMTGQFVRALGLVFHLDCFLCEVRMSLSRKGCSLQNLRQDCGMVVAAKFFPIDGPNGQQKVLCETDYFRRLDLLCAQCGMALRGSYITALDKKFHTEHFTCSVCTTVFGPQDSYYEHHGSVYCHFHYSCRFAVKCTGCQIAILKQFVEINRNNQDEHWHPECYMIHKFWNTKLAPSAVPKSPADGAEVSVGLSAINIETEWRQQESQETPDSLRERQRLVEEQVYRIWTVLSTFEESSAACISEMLRQVSGGQYFDGVEMAEKFVFHVETLFAGLDDLALHYRGLTIKEFSHVREARMLCKKIVSFFSLLSQSQESAARKMGITQELLSLVTGLAHYLKILIRIALTAALKLEREHNKKQAMTQFLNRLDKLARDVDARKSANPVTQNPSIAASSPTTNHSPTSGAKRTKPSGYRSLPRGLNLGSADGEATTDLCEFCKSTIEEECVRYGTSRRWHLACLKCTSCGRSAAAKDREAIRLVDLRLVEPNPGSAVSRNASRVFCNACAPGPASEVFEPVTRLEQYAFLLCVALNKLYKLLRQRGFVSHSSSDDALSPASQEDRPLYDGFKDSAGVKRMKSVNLDRKLSTTAQRPKRSTVVESPSGRQAQMGEDERAIAEFATGVRPSLAALTPTQSDGIIADSMLPSARSDESSGDVSPIMPLNTLTKPILPSHMTEVRVIDEQPDVMSPREEIRQHPLGDHRTQNEDGITLADLPQVMEQEQAREQQRPVMRQTQMALLSELSALEYIIVKHVAALTLGGEASPVRDLLPSEEIMDLLDARKNNNFWGKLFKGSNDRSKVKKKGVFGISLESLVERSGADSMLGAGPAPVRVPAFVDDVLSAMRQMDMSVEGVFRKNGNIRRLKELSDALDRDVGGVSLVDDNPVQLAALLKKFLRELPDPLLTFRLHNLFVATQRIEAPEDRLRMLHLVSCLLPKAHRDTMEVIFVFLKWVASFSHIDEETGSKMDLHNLATVICPNVLYARGKDPSKDESFLAIQAIHSLLEYQDVFWQVPEEFAAVLNDQDLFSNPEALTSKMILKRCQEYAARALSRTASRGQFGGTSPSRSMRGAVQPHHPHVHDGLPTLPSSTSYLPQFPSTPPGQRPLSANGFIGMDPRQL